MSRRGSTSTAVVWPQWSLYLISLNMTLKSSGLWNHDESVELCWPCLSLLIPSFPDPFPFSSPCTVIMSVYLSTSHPSTSIIFGGQTGDHVDIMWPLSSWWSPPLLYRSVDTTLLPQFFSSSLPSFLCSSSVLLVSDTLTASVSIPS